MPYVSHIPSLFLTLLLLLAAGCTSEADPPETSSSFTATPANGASALMTDRAGIPPNADTVMISGKRAVVWASSELSPQGGNSYAAANAFDGDPSTAWVEGVEGLGEGESVFVRFDQPTRIKAVSLIPGYAKSTLTQLTNSAPEEVTIRLDDYEIAPVRIPYWKEMIWEDSSPPGYSSPRGCYRVFSEENLLARYRISLSNPVRATNIQIRVTEISKGRRFEDTAISEVTFLTSDSPPSSLDTLFASFRSKDYGAVLSPGAHIEDLRHKFYNVYLEDQRVKFTSAPEAVYSRSELFSMNGDIEFPYFPRVSSQIRSDASNDSSGFFQYVRDSFLESPVVSFEEDGTRYIVGSLSFRFGSGEWMESYPALELDETGRISRAWEINRPGATPGCPYALPIPDSIPSYGNIQPTASPF